MGSRSLKTIFNCILYHGLCILLAKLTQFRKYANFSAGILIHSGMCFLVFSALSMHFSIESATWRWLMPDHVGDFLFGLAHQELTDLTIFLQMIMSTCLIIAAVAAILFITSLPVLSNKLLMIYRFWTVLEFVVDPPLPYRSTSLVLAPQREEKRQDGSVGARSTIDSQLDAEARENIDAPRDDRR